MHETVPDRMGTLFDCIWLAPIQSTPQVTKIHSCKRMYRNLITFFLLDIRTFKRAKISLICVTFISIYFNSVWQFTDTATQRFRFEGNWEEKIISENKREIAREIWQALISFSMPIIHKHIMQMIYRKFPSWL